MNSDRVELASVIVVLQASLLLVAGLIALPFAIVEPGLRILGVVTIVIAAAMLWLARNVRRQRRWARRWLIGMESLSLLISIALMLLPIGAVRGPVPVLVNLVLPATVVWLLWSRRPAMERPVSDARRAA
jgi:hypothetical protein